MKKGILNENLKKAIEAIQKTKALNESKLTEECEFVCIYLNVLLKGNGSPEQHKRAKEIHFYAFSNFDEWFRNRLNFYQEKRDLSKIEKF